jgi:hypothetical protein
LQESSKLIRILFSIFCCFSLASASFRQASPEILCDFVQPEILWNYVGKHYTCFVTEAYISSNRTIFRHDEKNITAVSFQDNHKIFYLPNKIGELTDLVALSANRCSLKSIKRVNFEDMYNLVVLFLNGNSIEVLENDVLSDLPALELIDLSK